MPFPSNMTTERLMLRPYHLEDLQAIHAYARIPIVSQYQLWGPNTLEDSKAFLMEAIQKNEAHPQREYSFAIIQRDEQKMIGGCGIYLAKAPLAPPRLGYILHPDYWNQGYATEATTALLRFAQQTLKVSKVEASCDKRNLASARVLEKNGFSFIEEYPRRAKVEGIPRVGWLFQKTLLILLLCLFIL